MAAVASDDELQANSESEHTVVSCWPSAAVTAVTTMANTVAVANGTTVTDGLGAAGH